MNDQGLFLWDDSSQSCASSSSPNCQAETMSLPVPPEALANPAAYLARFTDGPTSSAKKMAVANAVVAAGISIITVAGVVLRRKNGTLRCIYLVSVDLLMKFQDGANVEMQDGALTRPDAQIIVPVVWALFALGKLADLSVFADSLMSVYSPRAPPHHAHPSRHSLPRLASFRDSVVLQPIHHRARRNLHHPSLVIPRSQHPSLHRKIPQKPYYQDFFFRHTLFLLLGPVSGNFRSEYASWCFFDE